MLNKNPAAAGNVTGFHSEMRIGGMPWLRRWFPALMVVLWTGCTVLSILAPRNLGLGTEVLMLVAAPVLFGLCHGATRFGSAASLAFFAIALLVSNGFENLSIATGFPFGFYTHTALMGPKLFLVPLIVGPGYYGVCYIAWTLANALLGDPAARDRQWLIAMPLVAAFIVVGADICGDPIGATLGHRWIYPHGGAFFGVPLSNYLGWFLVTWVIFQLFACYLARHRFMLAPVRASFWYQAAAFWAVMGLQYPLILAASSASVVVPDAGGGSWHSGDILQTAAMTGIYLMLAVAVTSAFAVSRRHRTDPAPYPGQLPNPTLPNQQ